MPTKSVMLAKVVKPATACRKATTAGTPFTSGMTEAGPLESVRKSATDQQHAAWMLLLKQQTNP